MRKPSPALTAWIITGTALVGGAAILTSLWPAALNAAHQRSAQLTTEASRVSSAEAEVDYRLATWLDPNNAAAFAGLAGAQIAAGHPDKALATLRRAGQGREVTQLQVRILIELGHYNEAANAASQLNTPGRSDDDLVLTALAYALTNRNADIDAVAAVSSPEALQRIRRAQAGETPLAAELYATGLLQSSSALLSKLPVSFERNFILSRIRYTRHTTPDLNQAVSLLNDAIKLNPSHIEARRLLAAVYRDQGNATSAAAQDGYIAKLTTGRP